jgi:p-cumate 2,3-dioxygenase alpha subunit
MDQAEEARSSWIQDDLKRGVFRVNRATMTSEAVFALERTRIFDRAWVYVGHDSEVTEPGDYRRRTVAGRPLILVRGSDGQVRVLLNTCTHRGALVCRSDDGNSKTFQCFYHAWTFGNDGRLIGVPDMRAYGEDFDRKELSLKAPARVECYRGFYFASFVADGPDLVDSLGEIRTYMDITLDAGAVLGGWSVARGEVAYQIKANWKLMLENSIDNYHFDTVHQTYNAYMADRKASVAAELQEEAASAGRHDRGITTGFTVPGGHGGFTFSRAHSGRPLASWTPLYGKHTKDEIQRTRDRLEEAYGEERMRVMAEGSRSLLVFPNLMFQDSATGFRLRAIWPVAPGITDIRQWEFFPRDESASMRKVRMDGARAFLGPGGFATPDDIEAVESCQQGFAAEGVQWSDLSRGMTSEHSRDDHELQMRGFWRQWACVVDAEQDRPAMTGVR